MKKVYIFDMDGTLLDTLESLYVSVNATMGELGFGEITRAQCRAFVGNGAKYLMEQSILATENECSEALLEESMNIYKRVFAMNCMYKLEPYEGIQEILDYLKSKECKMGILSNKPHIRTVEIAEGFFGQGFFDYIQGQCDTVPRKPDPESLRYVMKQLGVEKEACVYIGDGETDLITGTKAEVMTIGVTWGFRDRTHLEVYNPTILLDTPAQLLEYVSHIE